MSLAYTLARRTMTSIYNGSLSTPPILDAKEFFPGAGAFVESRRAIRDEAMSLVDGLESVPQFHELMPEQYELSSHGEKEWRMFVLRAYGLDINGNMARCPQLAGLVAANPEVKSATLSFLAPGKHIPTHTGPCRGTTRFYLGIEVPEDETGKPGVELTIAGESYRLGNGESLLWDDTFPHSVLNHTEKWRIALLLDVYRADMPGPLRALTNAIIAMARTSIRWRGVFPKEFI